MKAARDWAPTLSIWLASGIFVYYLCRLFDRERQVRLMEYASPMASGLSKGVVDQMASNVADQIGYLPGAELEPIVERLGGRVVVQDLFQSDFNSSGSIRIEPDGSFSIFLAAHTGPFRDRFTIAHEIGHYILHYLIAKQNGAQIQGLEANRYGTGPVEWEANWFAAGFLMPADLFRQKAQEFSGSLSSLSSFFGVSMEAARVRASYLNIILS